MTEREPTLRERIGGRWAVSWQFVALFLLASTITFVGTVGPSAPQLSAFSLGAVSLASGLVTALVPLAASVTVLRDRAVRPAPIWLVVAVGMAIGLVRELTLRAGFAALGEQYPAAWLPRLPIAMVLLTLLMITTALFLDELDRLRRSIAALDERAVQLRSLERQSDALTTDLVAAVEERVGPAVTLLEDASRSSFDGAGRDPRAVARRLQAIVDDDLRPLSAQLYALEAAPLPRLGMWTVVTARLRAQPVTPLAAVALYFATTLFVAAQWQTPAAALDDAAINSLAVGACLSGVAWLARRGVLTRFALPLGILLAIVATTAKIVLLPSVEGTAAAVRLAIGNAVWVAVLVVITSLVGAALSGRSRQLPEIRASLDDREVERLAASRDLVRVSRDLANELHGRLQSTLLAAAFAIENAARTGDDAAVDQAIADARAALRDVAAEERPPAGGLAEELERRASLWRGFARIDIAIAPGVEPEPRTVEVLGRLAEEAISNAKKHGRATSVAITVDAPERDVLRLVVRDDGDGPAAGPPGVGSRQLDAVAAEAWSLRANGDGPGATLEVRLAVAAG
jgi:signal transduction histidine kinase